VATNEVTKRVLDILGKEQGMQAASNVTGALAGGSAAEAGASPLAQFLASLAGGTVPAVAKAGPAAGVRGTLRGGEEGRQTYNERIQDFADAGVDGVSVGQASGNRRTQAVESGFSKAPGGAGVMARQAEQEAAQIHARVNQIADDLMPGADATRAGTTIEKGVKNFVQRFKGEQDFLFSKLDKHIAPQSQVSVRNTREALANLNADIPGAPKLSEWFKNSKIQGIEGALDADLSQPRRYTPSQLLDEMWTRESGRASPTVDALPWEAVKKLRTLVGNEISNTTIASAVPRDKWKALYGALSTDMEAAAHQAGPEATKAFNRANWFTRAGYDRIESVLDRVTGNAGKTPEAIYKSAVSAPEVREGATTANAVMKSLTPEERSMVSAATIRRMGQANPGAQNAAGDAFSTETFLTNWNQFGDDAKRVLFADPAARQGLDDIALAAQRIREGSKVFANPSGTAQAAANYTAGGGLALSLLTGNLGAAAAIAAGVGATNAGARLMTNPNFVKWVGQTTRLSPGALPAQLNLLAQQASQWAPEDQAAVYEFIGTTQQAAGSARQ
jgi:hypothetical protein